MKTSIMFFVFSLLIILFTNSMNAQNELGVVGKIYSKVEADKLYGKVLESKTISTKTILEALNKVDYYIMFKVKEGKVAITNINRKTVAGDLIDLAVGEPMHIFSKTKVAEVLINGGEPYSTVERRADVLTITNGVYTLEMALTCPPICP